MNFDIITMKLRSRW